MSGMRVREGESSTATHTHLFIQTHTLPPPYWSSPGFSTGTVTVTMTSYLIRKSLWFDLPLPPSWTLLFLLSFPISFPFSLSLPLLLCLSFYFLSFFSCSSPSPRKSCFLDS